MWSLYLFEAGLITKKDFESWNLKYIKCIHKNKQTIKTVQNSFQERGIKTMHLGMWRILLSVEHQIGFLWYRRMARGSLKKKGVRDGWMNVRGQIAAIQPRMRLDFPPGGFLRPDGSPAPASSAWGASSGCPGTASGSLTLFSKKMQTVCYTWGT